jgi:hypothetical protein
MSRSVDKIARLWAEQTGFDPQQGQGSYLRHSFQTGSRIKPDSYRMDTEASLPWVKRPERKPDHSTPSSAVVFKFYIPASPQISKAFIVPSSKL